MKSIKNKEEAVKLFREKFEHNPKCLAIEDDDEDCICPFADGESLVKLIWDEAEKVGREKVKKEWEEEQKKLLQGFSYKKPKEGDNKHG